MAYKTMEEYLWELKMSFIKAIPPFLVASLAFSEIFLSKEFARNSYLLLTFTIMMIFLLSIIEIIKFGVSIKPQKKDARKVRK